MGMAYFSFAKLPDCAQYARVCCSDKAISGPVQVSFVPRKTQDGGDFLDQFLLCETSCEERKARRAQ